MITIKNAKWDFSKEENAAINYLNSHGFDGFLEKQYISKTKFMVSKHGVTTQFEVLNGAKGYSVQKSLSLLEQTILQIKELDDLRKMIND